MLHSSLNKVTRSPSRSSIARLIITAVALTAASSSHAGTFVVTTCLDNGVGSLRQAITNANETPGIDTVSFSVVCSTITLGSPLNIGEDLEITGPGAQVLTLSNPTGEVFALEPAAVSPAFQSVTIRALRFAGSRGSVGGAISSRRTNLTIESSVFSGNEGISLSGAVAFNSVTSEPRTLNINASTFVSNGRSGVASGGAVNAINAVATIRRSLFRQNGGNENVTGGGAVVVTGGVLAIEESAFYSNRGATGGAVTAFNNSQVRIAATTMYGNVALSDGETQRGGGALFAAGGNVRVENSTLAANTVQSDGKGAAIDINGGSLLLLNSTIANNRVESTAVQNASITASSDSENSMSVTLRNTVVTGTAALTTDQRVDLWAFATGVGAAPDLLQDHSLISILRNASGSIVASSGAQLAAATVNGGTVNPGAPGAAEPMLTLLPLAGSPLLNAGSSAAAMSLATDQRGQGFPRVIGAAVDIGSLEANQLIVDPPVNTPAQVVPTLSQQLLLLLSLPLLAIGAFFLGRPGRN